MLKSITYANFANNWSACFNLLYAGFQLTIDHSGRVGTFPFFENRSLGPEVCEGQRNAWGYLFSAGIITIKRHRYAIEVLCLASPLS